MMKEISKNDLHEVVLVGKGSEIAISILLTCYDFVKRGILK